MSIYAEIVPVRYDYDNESIVNFPEQLSQLMWYSSITGENDELTISGC